MTHPTPLLGFSNLSKQLTASLTKDEKKNSGIFFTPPSCIQYIMTLLRGIGVSKTIHNILEPSCGSGEFITALSREYPDANITGVEYHPVIYKAVSDHFAGTGRVVIHHGDFLKYDTATATAPAAAAAAASPDLIIGNPPYFVMKKEEVAPEYYPYFDGRPNIFTLFIIKAAQLLSDGGGGSGGILCFVLPSSFMNSQYYDKTRKYIVRHFKILHIVRCDNIPGSYMDTAQDTVIIMLQRCVGNDTLTSTPTPAGVYEKSGATIFTDNLPRLMELYNSSHSLHELGFKVSVGTVVWNQCKDILTDDAKKTLLIYSSNIENGQFVHKTYKNAEKKAFIDKPGIRTPMIVLNRGYGVGEYQFVYCLLTPEMVSASASAPGYLIENHLICITRTDSKNNDLSEFKRIIRSFQDPRTQEFISSYFGNNAINTTELNHMLPIYV